MSTELCELLVCELIESGNMAHVQQALTLVD